MKSTPPIIPSPSCRSGKILNGSSNCTPMSSIPMIEYEIAMVAGSVKNGPHDEYIANGIMFDHTNNKRLVCRVKHVGIGVF